MESLVNGDSIAADAGGAARVEVTIGAVGSVGDSWAMRQHAGTAGTVVWGLRLYLGVAAHAISPCCVRHGEKSSLWPGPEMVVDASGKSELKVKVLEEKVDRNRGGRKGKVEVRVEMEPGALAESRAKMSERCRARLAKWK